MAGIFLAAALIAPAFGSAMFSPEPAKTKHYVLEIRVFQGDPLAGKAGGKVEILTQPTVVAVEGKAATCMVGQKVMGIDADSPDFVGIALSVRPVEETDGRVRVEVGCKVSEIVAQSDSHIEISASCARRVFEVRKGETFRMQLKVQSATDQTWLEEKLTEIKETPEGK